MSGLSDFDFPFINNPDSANMLNQLKQFRAKTKAFYEESDAILRDYETRIASLGDSMSSHTHTKASIGLGNVEDVALSSRIGSTGPAGCRNKIRNPRFAVNQRNVSGTVTLSAGAYGHDGWKAGASGCTYTFSTTQNRTTLTITAGSLVQTVDGLDLAAGANTHTLSWGGSCQGKIGAGSYGASGITGLATGGTNINIEFSTGTLYEPQFEQGNIPSVFDQRPYSYDLGICERFYRKCSGYVIGLSSASGRKFISSPLPPMRATPTVVGISDSVGNVGKITTYDTVGNPKTNVTPTAFAVLNTNNILLAYAFVDNSTASGIFCSWTIGAEP